MTASRWTSLNEFLETIDPNDRDQLRDAIAAIHDAIAVTAEPILLTYKELNEETLTFGSQLRAQQIAESKIAVAIQRDEANSVLDAARLLRALEMNFLDGTIWLDTDRDEELEESWMTGDRRNYVIPRFSPITPQDGQPFVRRGLLNCRVIPTRIGGFHVRLHRSRLVRDSRTAGRERRGESQQYGAAFFPSLKPKLSPKHLPGFTIEKLEGFSARAEIDAHLSLGRTEGCAAIVWGELTMPETSVEHLQERLGEFAFEGEHVFRYMVAGSWHRIAKGEMRNVASVLDGDGELLFEVLKWAKFDIAGRTEAIEPGKEIHVLVGEEELTTVAICRDFLEASLDVPYRKLDVDIAVIPSMTNDAGEAQTLLSHAATANDMRVRFGTRTLVVAQFVPASDGNSGALMAFPDKPLVEPSVKISGNWMTVPLERP
jgi:predicted nucleotidyltransferase